MSFTRIDAARDRVTFHFDENSPEFEYELVPALVTPRTKGDVIVASPARLEALGVGSDGQVLTADSAETVGVKWATPASVITDHGGLSGLGDDDHTQYILATGTREFSGDQSFGGNDITNVGDVGSTSVSTGAVNATSLGATTPGTIDATTIDATGNVTTTAKIAVGTATVDGTYSAIIKAASSYSALKLQDSTGAGTWTFNVNSSGYGYFNSSATGNRFFSALSNGLEFYHGSQDRIRATRSSGILYFEAPSEIWFSTSWAQQFKVSATQMLAGNMKAVFSKTTAGDTREVIFQMQRQRTGGGAGTNFGATIDCTMHNGSNNWHFAGDLACYWTDATDTSESSAWWFRLMKSGSTWYPLTIDGNTDSVKIDADIDHDGSKIGVFSTAPVTKQTVTGSRASNAALQNLLTALANYGLITDSTT